MQEMKGLVVSQLCDQLQRSSRTEIGCGLRRHIYPAPVTLLILQLDQFILRYPSLFGEIVLVVKKVTIIKLPSHRVDK